MPVCVHVCVCLGVGWGVFTAFMSFVFEAGGEQLQAMLLRDENSIIVFDLKLVGYINDGTKMALNWSIQQNRLMFPNLCSLNIQTKILRPLRTSSHHGKRLTILS